MEQAAFAHGAVQRDAFAHAGANARHFLLGKRVGEALDGFVEGAEQRRAAAEHDADESRDARTERLPAQAADDRQLEQHA